MIRGESGLDVFVERAVGGGDVTRVRRIFYEFEGNVDRREGPVEISISGESFVFESGHDGYVLSVRVEEWSDPFSGELSDINREYIKTHGKWVAVDVVEGDPEHFLIGRTIERVLPIVANDTLVGAGIEAGSKMLVIRSAFDETIVEVTDKD